MLMQRRSEFLNLEFDGIVVDAARAGRALEKSAMEKHRVDSGKRAASRLQSEAKPKKARWYCLHVEQGCEIAVEKALLDSDVEAMVARETFVQVRRGSGEKAVVTRALFPSYVLVRCVPSDEAFGFLRHFDNVRKIIGGDSGYHVIRDEDVSLFKTIADGGDVPRMKTDKSLAQGDRALIHMGPFAGFDCIVTAVKWCRMARASVRIALGGRQFDIDSMPVAFLKKL
jgi:transcriptional antiterminator NusG